MFPTLHPVWLLPFLFLGIFSCRRIDLQVPRLADDPSPTQTGAIWQHEKSQARVRFFVEADTLVVELRSLSPMLARGLRTGDPTVWLDETGGKDQHFGLQFRGPLGMPERSGELPGPHRDTPRPGREPMFIDEPDFDEQIHVLLEPDEDTALLPLRSPLNGCQSFTQQGREWVLRLGLPLGVPLDGTAGVILQPGSRIGLGLVQQKAERFPGPARGSGMGTRPTGPPGGMGGQGGGPPPGLGGGGAGRPGGGRGGGHGTGPGGGRPVHPAGANASEDPLKVWFRLELPPSVTR